MGRPEYVLVRCKSALNRVQGMPFRWSLNPYAGCRHACVYCLGPNTPVLYADLTWRPIGNVRLGDVLVGFDEYPTADRYRYFRPAVVEAMWWSKRRTRRLITNRGEAVTTDEHRWLRGDRHWWTSTRHLGPGRLLRSFDMYATGSDASEDYRAGYICGMTLGDGTFRYQPGQRSEKLGFPVPYWRVALGDYEPLERLVAYLATFGVRAAVRPFDAGHSSLRPMRKVETRSIANLGVVHSLVCSERCSSDYYRGFLAGFFDAEGSLHGCNLRMTQKDPAVLERVVRYGARLGFDFRIERYEDRCAEARLYGSLHDRVRFAALCRPAIARKGVVLAGQAMRLDPVEVEAVEPGPVTDVVDIQTSTGTFFAAGLATHNCFARQFYVQADHGGTADFAVRILVKENFPDVLRGELARPSWQGEAVVLGTATDPYQPAEGRFRLTRRTLEALLERANPFSMLTKSPLALRDLDLLAELARVTSVRVYFSITTVDLDLWRMLEPGTANPFKRLDVLRALRHAGVPAGVLMAPVLPGLTDSVASIQSVAEAAKSAGAAFFGASALRLMPHVKDHYLGFVAGTFPELTHRYLRAYPGPYAPREYVAALERRVERVRAGYGFADDEGRARPAERRTPPLTPRQLALPLEQIHAERTIDPARTGR